MKVAVLGAGAAGLAAARALTTLGAEVVVFEAAARAGGKIQTHAEGGFRCEEGPNALAAASPTALRLVRELGLEIVEARPPRARFVFRRGALRAAPSAGLLSPLGWARALLEPFAQSRPGGEETLWAFFTRHLGTEAGGLAATLMAAGVYGGDPKRLSIQEAFRKVAALEDWGGSLFFGALRSRGKQPQTRETGGPTSLWSLAGGLGQLPDAMAAALGPAVRFSTPVVKVERADEGYRLQLGGSAPGELQGELRVHGLLSALPPQAAGKLLADLAPGLGRLAEIRSSPIAVVHLGFRRDDLPREPKGFGVLDGDGDLGVLGTLFPSSLFAGRAPDGHVLLTSLIGGIQSPELLALDDQALAERCQATVRRLFGAERPPTFRRIVRWSEAVPQPELGHAERISAARLAAGQLPPLELAGGGVSGVAVEQVLAGGEAAATRLWGRLNGAPVAGA